MYNCISWHIKSCWFPVKKMLILADLKSCVRRRPFFPLSPFICEEPRKDPSWIGLTQIPKTYTSMSWYKVKKSQIGEIKIIRWECFEHDTFMLQLYNYALLFWRRNQKNVTKIKHSSIDKFIYMMNITK